jgi:hypothetical protein
MKLSDLVIPTKEIKLGGQSVEFRGLSFLDLEWLLTHGLDDDIDALFALFQSGVDADGNPLSEEDLFGVVVSKFPQLVAAVLSMAADDDDDEPDVAAAKRLPLGFQIEALEAVVTLTTEAAGGTKKLLDKVKDMIGGMSGIKS